MLAPNRRQFLTALGLTSGSLALPSLGGRRAWAGTTVPARLIVLFTHHGCVHERWRMRPGGEPETVDFEADLTALAADQFSPVLAPLYGHRDRLLVVDGLSLVSAYRDPGLSDLHAEGQLTALTGSNVDSSIGAPASAFPSVDQRIAQAFGRADRLTSLEVGIHSSETRPCYSDPLNALPVEENPALVWDRLFGLSQGGGNDTIYAAQASVLDRAQAAFSALSAKLSGEDRAKLEQHRDLIGDLEVRIEGMRAVTCDETGSQGEEEEELGYDAAHRSMVDLVTSAMRCDVTRVATLVYGDQPGELCGVYGEDIHGAYAHSARYDPASTDVMTVYGANHAQHMADLLDALAAVPDGGGTLLDNTMVVWVSELGNSEHGFETWPAVIAGGSAFSGWRMGRYLRYAPSTPPLGRDWQNQGIHQLDWPNDNAGVPHQKLLVSIARAFGLTDESGALVSSVGETSTTAYDGTPIDLTGPLDGLT